MKRLVFVLIVLVSFVLTACGDGAGRNPVKTVKALYDAGFNKDTDKIDSLLTHFNGYQGYEEEVAEDLYDHVAEVGGMKKLKIAAVKKSEMQENFAVSLDDYFGENWTLVLVPFEDSDYVMAWVLQKIDGKFYVVDADDFYMDKILVSAAKSY